MFRLLFWNSTRRQRTEEKSSFQFEWSWTSKAYLFSSLQSIENHSKTAWNCKNITSSETTRISRFSYIYTMHIFQCNVGGKHSIEARKHKLRLVRYICIKIIVRNCRNIIHVNAYERSTARRTDEVFPTNIKDCNLVVIIHIHNVGDTEVKSYARTNYKYSLYKGRQSLWIW